MTTATKSPTFVAKARVLGKQLQIGDTIYFGTRPRTIAGLRPHLPPSPLGPSRIAISTDGIGMTVFDEEWDETLEAKP